MGNFLAFAALALFLPFAILVLALSRSRPAFPATALLIGGYMFLPERVAFDFPGLPVLGKESIINLSIVVGLLVTRPRVVASARPGTGLELLAVILIAASVATVLSNRDPLFYGPVSLPPLRLADLPTAALSDLISFGLPFLLGRCAIRDSRDLRSLMIVLAVAGLVYSLPIFLEIRLSPQLQWWIYGVPIDMFDSTWRFGGFRPIVFMGGGLHLTMFMATTVLAACALARAGIPLATPLIPIPPLLVSVYLILVFIACRSLGALLLCLPLALAIYFLPLRALNALAASLICLFLLYPLLRVVDAIPVDAIVSAFAEISEDRSESLAGRLRSEGLMLEKALERLPFGWGSYQRSWVFDPVTGEELIAPDGFWIVTLTSRGVIGFAATFGMLTLPVLMAARRLARVPDARTRVLMIGVMLAITMRTIDYLPNGWFGGLVPLYLAGGLQQLQRSLAPRRGAHSRPT